MSQLGGGGDKEIEVASRLRSHYTSTTLLFFCGIKTGCWKSCFRVRCVYVRMTTQTDNGQHLPTLIK